MTFLQQGRDIDKDFFENFNHSGNRVVAKALSDKEGPSSTWSWRTTPMCDSQIAVAIEVRQSGAGGRTVLGVWPTCWYLPRSTRAGILKPWSDCILQWRSSEELLTWAYVVGGAECQSSWHSRCTHDQCGLARTSGCWYERPNVYESPPEECINGALRHQIDWGSEFLVQLGDVHSSQRWIACPITRPNQRHNLG